LRALQSTDDCSGKANSNLELNRDGQGNGDSRAQNSFLEFDALLNPFLELYEIDERDTVIKPVVKNS